MLKKQVCLNEVVKSFLKNNFVFLIPIFCSILFFYQLDTKLLWLDEFQTWETIRQPSIIDFIVKLFQRHAHPPLYFLMMWPLNFIFDWNEITLRLPSAISMLIANVVLFNILLKRINIVFAAGCSLLFGTTYYIIYYAQEARPYALFILLALLCFQEFLNVKETPKKFNLNPKIARQFATKAEMIEGKIPCDWSMGEGLAFASLLYDGSGIRLSGEDAKRGTFSHRHAILVDQKTEEEYTPFANLKPNQGHFKAYSSHLSEYGVLAFEYGYSTVNPNSLTIWEAQFGDFANGAQIVIDQYIASAEAKWLQMSALTILLPHGNEGQGPEHTSARLERYLQLYSDSNMLICNCTTPASLFHVLRRQIYAKFRKPLVLMTPKSLLRHKLAVSDLAEMGTGTAFQPLIATTVVGDKVVPLQLDITTNNHKANKTQPTSQIKNQIKRIIFCSGKIYYDLLQKIQDDKIEKYLLVRLEQLAPFPVTEVSALLSHYNDAAVIWCQEEHKNMGGYSFVLPYFMLFGTFPRYAGRAESASPSTGFAKVHAAEHAKVLSDALL